MSNHSFPEGATTHNATGTTTSTTTHNATGASPNDQITDGIKIGMTSAYAVIFSMGLFGNVIGLTVVCKKTNSRSVANVLISNMAAADLLVTLSIVPYSVIYLYVRNLWFGGVIGHITCPSLYFVFAVSIAASVLTILVVSIDKFYAVFYPLRGRLCKKAKLVSALVWIASVILMSPNLFFWQNIRGEDERYYCVQKWFWEDDINLTESFYVLKLYHVIAFVCLYAAPLSIIAVLHVLIGRRLCLRKIPGNSFRNRKTRLRENGKALKLLSAVVVAFALLWIPAYVMHFYIYFYHEKWQRLPIQVPLVSFWITHAQSSVNPCLYILFNGKFRQDFTTALKIRSFFERHADFTSRESIARNSAARSLHSIVSFGRTDLYNLSRNARASTCSSISSGASLRRVTHRSTTV